MKKFVVLIAVAATCAFAAFFIPKMLEKKQTAKVDAIVSLIVSNKRQLAELVTCRTVKDTLMIDTRERSGLSSIVYDAGLDTVAIYIAHIEISAGVDLSKLAKDDFEFSGDTLYLRVPSPEILDVRINVDDIVKVYEGYGWDYDSRMPFMVRRTKQAALRSALHSSLLGKAAARTETSLSAFLTKAFDMPVVVSCSQASVSFLEKN